MKHISDYYQYCISCKHSPLKDTDEPCNTCLTSPINDDSYKPKCYEYEDKKAKGVNLRGEPKEE